MKKHQVAPCAAFALVLFVHRPALADTMGWTFQPSVPPAYASYIDELLQEIYPRIVALYGAPSRDHEVRIGHDPSVFGGYYDPLTDEIVLGDLPGGGRDATSPDPGWDYFVAHEFTHAFHSEYYFASWIEEGMTEANGQLLARRLRDEGRRDLTSAFDFLRAVRWYDTFANMGPAILGGVDWSRGYADWWAAAESYTALFVILGLSQVEGRLWDWPRYQPFAGLNERLYATEQPGMIAAARMIELVGQTMPLRVDGLRSGEWIAAQPLAAQPARQGRYLAVYASRFTTTHDSPVNPNAVFFFAFEWGPDAEYPTMTVQRRIENGAEVSIEIFDIDDTRVFAGSSTLITAVPDYPNGNMLALPDTRSFAAGAYRVEATATVAGEKLRAKNSFLAGLPDLQRADDGLGIITVDEQGRISDAPWTASGDCEVSLQQRGAAVLRVTETGRLPARCTLTSAIDPAFSHTITVPLPATRIVTLVGPPGDATGPTDAMPTDSAADGAPPVSDGSPADPRDAGKGCAVGGDPRPTSGWLLLLLLVLARLGARPTIDRR